MRSIHERLATARKRAGYDTPTDAARALNVAPSTYLGHENGSRGLGRAAARYATFFRVSLDWLLNGRGDMRQNDGRIEIWGKVSSGSAILPATDDAASMNSDSLYMPAANALAALRVSGESQYPRFEDGEIILFETTARPPSELINCYCVCHLEDGRKMVKRLRRGSDTDLFDLESHNAPPERDVKLSAAYRIVAIML